MGSDSGTRSSYRGGGGQDLFPKWMWVVVPILVILVLAGIWALVVGDGAESALTATPSPTQVATVAATAASEETEPTEQASGEPTLPALDMTATPTREVLPLKTRTPTPAEVAVTPTPAAGEDAAELAVGDNVTVAGTGGAGLNMRAGAGTGHAKVKTLREGAKVEIIGGPEDADGYIWWQVRDAGGATGWVVEDFLSK